MQSWAEMYHYYITGNNLSSLTTQDENIITCIQKEREAAAFEDHREGLIAEFLEGKEATCIYEIWTQVFHPSVTDIPKLTRSESNEIAEILVNRLHWTRGTSRVFSGCGKQKSFLRPRDAGCSGEIELL